MVSTPILADIGDELKVIIIVSGHEISGCTSSLLSVTSHIERSGSVGKRGTQNRATRKNQCADHHDVHIGAFSFHEPSQGIPVPEDSRYPELQVQHDLKASPVSRIYGL